MRSGRVGLRSNTPASLLATVQALGGDESDDSSQELDDSLENIEATMRMLLTHRKPRTVQRYQHSVQLYANLCAPRCGEIDAVDDEGWACLTGEHLHLPTYEWFLNRCVHGQLLAQRRDPL